MEEIARLPRIAMAFATFIFMLIVDFYWGRLIFSFADGLLGTEAFVIKLMITITLFFGTFGIPILIFSDKLNPSPFNLIYGIVTMLVGIPLVLMVFWVITPLMDLLLTDTLHILVINGMMLFAIIFFGFVNPILAMIQDDKQDINLLQALETKMRRQQGGEGE